MNFLGSYSIKSHHTSSKHVPGPLLRPPFLFPCPSPEGISILHLEECFDFAPLLSRVLLTTLLPFLGWALPVLTLLISRIRKELFHPLLPVLTWVGIHGCCKSAILL